MDKRQQRLVRHQLKSLLSIPLFNQEQLKRGMNEQSALKRAFLGVLNYDSDDRILELFAKNDVLETAKFSATMVAQTILRR